MVAQILLFNLQSLRWIQSRQRPRPVILIHNTIGALAPAFLHKLFGQPYFLDLTDIHSEYFMLERMPWLSNWVKRVFRGVEIALIRGADHIVVVSQSMKDYLEKEKIPSDRMSVAHDGADLMLHGSSSSKIPGAEKHVLHISHTDYLTQVEVFVRAIPLVLEQCPDTIFDLVVRGRGVKQMERLLHELKVMHACRWHSPRPRQELTEIFRQAEIGIIQRRDMTANHLVVTGKLFDYWAKGMAVISTRLNGIQEITEDRQNILFCDPGSAESMARAIMELRTNDDLRKRLMKGGVATVQRFELSTLADQISDVLLSKQAVTRP
jgi:glycosyltransferase involved in cell wall biosynthesis